MSAPVRAGHRPRRVASDEAHAWARNLRLNNPLGKLVMAMLCGYVNGDGVCWVGQESLACDCDLALETVRKKLAWLEKIGAIARSPRWLDANGVRNGEGRGKRTTDDIKLLLFADIGRIEFLAAMTEPALDAYLADGKNAVSEAVSREQISPPPHGGLIQPAPEPAHALAPQQPPSCVGGIDSSEPEPEPEPESPPSPSGGESDLSSVVLEEPEDFAPARAAWPFHELGRRNLDLAEFAALSLEDQRICRAAVPHYVQMRKLAGRTFAPPKFHIWVRSRGFDEFKHLVAAAPAAPASTSIEANSTAGRAIKALFAIARTPLFEHRGVVVYPRVVTPQLVALAGAGEPSGWLWIEDRQQIAAWSAFLAEHVHRNRPQLVRTRGVGVEQRSGIYAPWPWPPRKDGSLSPPTGDAA